MVHSTFARALWLAVFLAATTAAQAQDAKVLITRAMQAMGGEQKLNKIQKVEAHYSGHAFAAEQSERPEGPWYATYINGDVVTDFVNVKQQLKGRVTGVFFESGFDLDVTADLSDPAVPKVVGPPIGISMRATRERLALGPERLLQTALDALDLRTDKQEIFHGVPNDVVRFTWGNTPVRILINHYTHLPAAVETTQVADGFWAVWGDVTVRTVWANWDFATGGAMIPTLWSIQRNGFEHENFTLTDVKVTYGDTASPTLRKELSSPGTVAKLQPFKTVDIAPGIVQYQSGFNCAAVDQGDGIVILEGVVSSEYMEGILADVEKRFPGKPIKAVLSSDDAWPHFGGLRLFAARGVPIYALALNKPILTRLFQSKFTMRPDALQRNPRKPKLTVLDGRFELGKGKNRMELYPMHGSGTERMLYAYFPELKLIYAPDVIQRSKTQWFAQNYLNDLLIATARDGVQPETAFAFHSGPIPFSDIQKVVAEAKGN